MKALALKTILYSLAHVLRLAEGRKKDVPEPHPLPAQFAEEFGVGLQRFDCRWVE